MHELRSYRSKARCCHMCDHCCHEIWPGQRYQGIVYAIGGRQIMTIKQHVNPMCERDPDPDPANEGGCFTEERQELKRAA